MWLFLIPTLIVLAIVGYAVIATTTVQNGTLYVRAQSSDRYYPTQRLDFPVDVAGKTVTSPANVSLPQGLYTVTFPAQTWYTSPFSETATVRSGQFSYAVGVYNPIVEVISVGSGSFNRTTLIALHNVTPVVWLNPSGNYQVIFSNVTGRVIIPPLGNYTYIFQSSGTFVFSFPLARTPTLVVRAV